ncbi:MAG TPA: rod shape-determining protein RodA, partial [Gammaproteobacteria bacterium]|nr:rod shape-determining protein RodA [Gammaproteobacteria bacterium]
MRAFLRRLSLDPLLLGGIGVLIAISCVVLYSASGQDSGAVIRQGMRFGLGLVMMILLAQIGIRRLYLWTPALYLLGVVLLLLVTLFGHSGKGAQRWLDLGFFKFQPAEVMKLGMPMMVAFYFSERRLPPAWNEIFLACLLVIVPVALIYFQPDLGTALLVGWSGIVVIFMAGIRWRTIFATLAAGAGLVPVLWHFMHDYQRRRVLTFLNPETDPLGAGYHIIQSEIALGSGGVYGSGWMGGTQSQLAFLPEQTTDFIFSVYGEEFGLMGVLLLFSLYLLLVFRGLQISWRAQDTYGRLLGTSLSMTFFIYFFVNVGMVSGLLPVVGVPLPLVSYGGTSVVTLMSGFGILMAIQG